jgi:hypothetical protein
MDPNNFWTWFIVETIGGVYVVGVLYYFFIRKFKKEQKEDAQKRKKDSEAS